jgi:hypothetical protein
MKSLKLTDKWDLTLDASGNIATVTGDEALAQDVACACRLFAGELWYDTGKGVPYLENILGRSISAAFFKAKLIEAALTVPGVVDAKVYIDKIDNRNLVGRVQFTDAKGIAHSVIL